MPVVLGLPQHLESIFTVQRSGAPRLRDLLEMLCSQVRLGQAPLERLESPSADKWPLQGDAFGCTNHSIRTLPVNFAVI